MSKSNKNKNNRVCFDVIFYVNYMVMQCKKKIN